MSDKNKNTLHKEKFVPYVPALVVLQQLRRMAAGEAPYKELADTSPWTKNIWEAAAALIEEYNA